MHSSIDIFRDINNIFDHGSIPKLWKRTYLLFRGSRM